MNRSLRPSWPVVLLVLLSTAACLDASDAERGRLIVFAPVELQPALDRALQDYSVRFESSVAEARYGRSSDLIDLVANRSAHIALTSHSAWARFVAERVVLSDRGEAGRDRLVLAAMGYPAALAAGGEPLARLAEGSLGRLALPSPESDSVGMYAREAMLRSGIWARVERSTLSVSDSPAAIQALRAGTASVAVLFESNAAREGLAILQRFDAALHSAVRFEVLLLDERHLEARQLFEFLAAPDDGVNLGRQ